MESLTEDIPQYNLPDLNWYRPDMTEFDNVFDSGTAVVDVGLIQMMSDIYNAKYKGTNVQEQ